MSQPPEKLSRAQKLAKEYMDKHGVEKIVNDMLNTLVHVKDEKPIIFMIKYLSGLCPEEELSENGIKIAGKLPKRLPVLRYPRFPESCNSLLKKHLTETMWRELRNMKTKHEGRLANCILAGIEEPELPVGVYACDGEAYLMYRQLFEPIIKDLHDYDLKSGATVRHNFDISGLEWGRLERTKHCIKFVQVTGSRNIEGYPFVPILDSLSKCEIENKLAKVLVEEIDAKAPINKMKELERKRFSDENLLFGRHPSIEKVVPNAKWGEGCSIYYNNDLSQVIWINADDHIQFFITHRINPDLKTACEKLFQKIKLLESQTRLAHDPNIGYLTCNPAFLGTALRIKVIVQLQRASDSQIKFELLRNYCMQHGVEVRFAGSNTYEFTLNKTFQLGKTESEMIGGLVNSLADLLRIEETIMVAEEEMMKKKIMEENEKILKEMPVFDEINTSLIRPFIDEDLWLRLGRVPSSFGHSLKDCVKPGVANHKIGIIALDADCYHKFEELFMNVINIYHEDYKLVNFPLIPGEFKELGETLKKYENLKYFEEGYVMWQGNIKECSFPGGLTKKQREECVMKILSTIDTYSKQQMLIPYGIEENDEVKNTLYFNDIMVEKNKIQEFSNDWPDQRLILKSQLNKLAILINVLNHVALCVPLESSMLSSDLFLFFTAYDALVTKLSSAWAISEKLGFYNSLPTELGNGFTIKISMRLPSVTSLGSYLQLAESKHVVISVVDNVMYLTHRHKFANFYQCLIDVLEVANQVSKQEEGKEKPSPAAKIEEAKSTFPGDYKGLANSVITESLIKEFDGIKTASGLTIEKILSTSIANPSDKIGVFVESSDSLAKFEKLFSEVAKKAHGEGEPFDFSSMNRNSEKLEPIEILSVPSPATAKILGVSRNLNNVVFPAYMTDVEREQVLTSVSTALNEKIKGSMMSIEDAGTATALQSAGFSDFIKLKAKNKDGIYSNWAKHRAVFISEDQAICILVNGRNHIKILSKITENNLSAAYAKLVEVHNIVAEKVAFCFDPKYGYLTSDIPQIGSGGLYIEVHKPSEGVPEGSISKSKIRNIVSEKVTPTLTKYKAQALYGTGIKEISESLVECLESHK